MEIRYIKPPCGGLSDVVAHAGRERGPAILKRAGRIAERVARELHWGPHKVYRLLVGALALPPDHADM